MSSRGYNKLAQILSGNCLTGISIAWWKWTHNAHHIACNSLDHDPDLQHIPVFAFTLNHFSANVYVGLPTGNDWFEKQTSGTIDISCSSTMDWFFGGLSFWEANKSTIRTLRTAALEARYLTNPAPKNLLWEAINTHG
ncbi:Delta(8)-fatty-acid desaturase [Hibiscus syriacus]|uniref:Delta(8)-fatty-acid desaturase n=1 Tax=Hibiscus syriacus TaxID=106335 RepID=A0A6A2XKC1_HIBSY|nr:Delta(8)-fatty-acid desaturase [Hibiscus syriacus]